MPDPFIDEDRSLFLSILDTLDRPGQAVRNVLRGKPGSAGRQLGQLGTDIIDAFLPGDWLPNDIAEKEDYVSGGELVGIKEPGIGKTLADIGIGIATDPLSFLTAGAGAAGKAALKVGLPFTKGVAEIPGSARAIEAAGGAIKKGYGKLPEKAREGVEAAGRTIRSTFGAQRAPAAIKGVIDSGRAGKIEAEAGMKAAKAALQGFDDRQLDIIGDAIDNFRWQDGKLVGELADGDLMQRILAHPDVDPADAGRLADAAGKVVEISRNQKGRRGVFSAESQKNLSDEYLQRHYDGLDEQQAFDRATSGANAMKERKLKGWQEVAEFLSKPDNAKVKYERNALRRSLGRSSQQGEIAKRADIGQGVMDLMRRGDIPMPKDPKELNRAKEALTRAYTHDSDAAKAAVRSGLDALRKTDPEATQLLSDAYNGLPKPGWIGRMLQRGNEIFKPSATAGYALPNLAFNIRNRLSGIWQTLSNSEARGATGAMAGRALTDIPGAIADGLGLAAPDRLGKVLNAWEDALATSGGSAENAFRIMESGGFADEAALLRTGVLDGFVRGEDIMSELTKPGMLAKLHRMAKWPLKITKGIEDRMRLGLALDVMDSGKAPAEAARIARDTLFSYDTNSAANRGFRQAVPFGQFLAKAVPSQAKFLAEKPAVAVGLASALGGQDDEPVYPYMEGKLNLPWLPDDAEGNRQYITGLGLPFEALNQIPGSFRDVKRNVVGSMTPPLKTALAATFGEDPYFETPFGSYDKFPLYGKAGEVGEAYNVLAGTGLIQPIASPLRTLDQLLDERRGLGTKAVGMLGAKVANVDPDLALQQQLQEALKDDPDVRQFRSYFADEEDDATQALIKAYYEAKSRMKAKQKP